jgi:hypothetical protein
VRRKFTRDDLEFLLLIVGQAAAVSRTCACRRRPRKMAVLEERARIAATSRRFIQSLAGIDLRIEACKMLLQDGIRARSDASVEELAHQAADLGYQATC